MMTRNGQKMIAAGAAFLLLSAIAGQGAAGSGFSPYVDENGAISRPEGYRTGWAHLGSWVVPDEDAPGAGFHDVYTRPEAVEMYRKNGSFPDGTVLVKEIREVKSDDLTTGRASWAGEPTVWFVMIKDAEGRFPENGNWGNGWGWALFKSDAPAENVSTDFRKDCIGCHLPAEKTDWVFTRGYPTLR